jgi:LysM repeat protein
MWRAILILFLSNLGITAHSASQPKLSATDYVSIWKDEAIYQMVVHKVPASITLAQGLLESGNGNSRLAVEGNNHFGIKCHSDWTGAKIHEDDETNNECFRKYKSASESFEDHSLFLQKKRYQPLFALDIDDYKGWAKGLKECGYATNPKYAQLLINLIEQYELHQYDELALQHIRKNTIPERPHGQKHKPVFANTEKKPKNRNNTEGRTEISIGNNRAVNLSSNRIKYIIAKSNDTPESIAKELDMAAWQIKKYNDLSANQTLREGDVVYLQPKRNRAAEAAHVVQPGESLRDISQKYGVKIKKIRQRNELNENVEPKPGTKLILK